MIEKRKKNKVIIIALILMVIGTIITTMGVSFSFFAYSRGSKVNKVVTGNLEFSMLDGESVLLTNAYPQSDRDGLNNTPYTFTVNNTSSEGITISYYLSLLTSNDDSSKSYFKNNQIKYNLTKNGIEVVSPRLLSSIDGFNVDSSKGDGVVLDNQEITAKSTDRYELRIWIDENVEYTGKIDENGLMTSTNQYEYSLKVRINARNKVDDGSGSGNPPVVKQSILKKGVDVLATFRNLAGYIGDYNTYDNITTEIKTAKSVPENITTRVISMPDSEVETVAWFDNGTIYVYSEGQIVMNEDSSLLFSKMPVLTDISALKDWDISNVIDMSAMFSGCKKLEDLSSLTNWNTSNVTNMKGMFANCINLTNLNSLENWDTKNVRNTSSMFFGCSSLTNLNGLENWDTLNVIDMNQMFSNCSNITNLNSLVNWNTASVTNMKGMFKFCSALMDASGLENWDISNVIDISDMFYRSPGGIIKPSWYK